MSENICLRKALLTDVEDFYKIEKACFNEPWSKNLIFESLLADNSYYEVIQKDLDIIAVGGFEVIVGQAHIMTVAVLPEYRREGYADMLFSHLLQTLKENNINEVTLEVRVSNKPAIALYEKYGFKNYGVRKKYYVDNNEDAYIMWKID